MTEEMTRAAFCRKAIHIRELKELHMQEEKKEFRVEKIAEITPEEFQCFADELYEYYRVFYEEKDAMYLEDEGPCFHCILVTTPERKEGVLVEAEGFAYARYSAYVPDCGKLDLSGVEVLEKADMSHRLPAEYYQNPWSGTQKKEQTEGEAR